jgi:hypothetical protein
MIHMPTATREQEAIRAIVKIIEDQQKLENHQRRAKAAVTTLQDLMVYAHDQIKEVMEPYLPNSRHPNDE